MIGDTMTGDATADRGGRLVVRVDADLEDLVPRFLENRRKDVTTLPAALDRGDYDAVRAIGHDMKGSGAAYGFDPITALGAGLEQAAKEERRDEIVSLTDELAAYLEQVDVVYE